MFTFTFTFMLVVHVAIVYEYVQACSSTAAALVQHITYHIVPWPLEGTLRLLLDYLNV